MKKQNEKEIILNSNYLINMLYIYKEKGYINHYLFSIIVKTCTPYDNEISNETLKTLKDYEFDFYINNTYFKYYNNRIKQNDKISFKIGKKSKIEIEAKYVNWDIKENLFSTLDSEYYMLAIKYPENTKYNYFVIDNEIKKSVNSLFRKIIKSPAVKQAMIFDEGLIEYKYLLNEEKILTEFENNVHLVYFPFDNYNGYTDKKSFDIYLNISFKIQISLPRALTKFKLFFISKCHEFKHATRIYMKLYNNIDINTPLKKLKDFKEERNYILKIHENSLNNIINSSINYSKDSKIFKKTMREYGELFEYALFGYKIDVVFFYTVILFLKESTWKLSPEEFYFEYNKAMKDKKTKSINILCKGGLPKLIYNYFRDGEISNYYSNYLISKDSSTFATNENILISIQRESHLPKYIKDDEYDEYFVYE